MNVGIEISHRIGYWEISLLIHMVDPGCTLFRKGPPGFICGFLVLFHQVFVVGNSEN
jgi:hypothetical protein